MIDSNIFTTNEFTVTCLYISVEMTSVHISEEKKTHKPLYRLCIFTHRINVIYSRLNCQLMRRHR